MGDWSRMPQDAENPLPSFHPVNLSIKSLASLLFLFIAVPAQAVTIWTIGDSLTSGFTVAGAYRTQLYNALNQAGEPVALVGSATNDLNQNISVATAPNRLALLLTRLEGLAPAARIIVGSVPKASETNNYKNASVTNLNGSINFYNSAISAVITAHANGGKNVKFLDVSKGIHLTEIVRELAKTRLPRYQRAGPDRLPAHPPWRPCHAQRRRSGELLDSS